MLDVASSLIYYIVDYFSVYILFKNNINYQLKTHAPFLKILSLSESESESESE